MRRVYLFYLYIFTPDTNNNLQTHTNNDYISSAPHDHTSIPSAHAIVCHMALNYRSQILCQKQLVDVYLAEISVILTTNETSVCDM